MPMYSDDENPVKAGGISTPHASAVIVFGAMVFLILVRRGFRGVSLGGVSVGVR
jgi:hypothetical protein